MTVAASCGRHLHAAEAMGLFRSSEVRRGRVDIHSGAAGRALGCEELLDFGEFGLTSHERLIYLSGVCFASGCAASRQGSHTLNLRGFRHAAVEGAEHQVLLTVSIEAQADERCSVELLSAILALNRALHPDG